MKLGSVLREPLMHFAVLGALLFAIDGARSAESKTQEPVSVPTASGGVIEVSDVVRQRLVDTWQTQNGAPPSADELERMIEHWIREEVLFREGLARGLDRDDERVRSRVASKMGFVLDAQLVVPDPTDDEVRAYFDAHADQWSKETRVDFTHVFATAGADAAKRAGEMLRKLEAGADANGMGDSFSGGRRYRARQVDSLATQFGATFVEGLDAQPVGSWKVRTSRFGVHVVRVDARTTGSSADFEAAKLDARHALVEERRKAAFDAATDAMRARWRVVRAP